MKRSKLPRSGAALMLCALLLTLFICDRTFAQTSTSSVTGRVTDPQGNVVAGATVTLTSADTNAARTQTTNENGAFVFDLIPPGTYRLEAEATGFKKIVVNDVRALVAKPTELTVQLEVGNIAESVTVSAGGAEALINTQDAALGNNFESRQITQLPIESRNVVQLLSLQPGVTRSGYVTGARSDQTNVTLDGVDVNEQETGLDVVELESFSRTQAFASVLRVTPDSIQEFRVTTSNPNATQGRSSGGQVALITKSGSNDWHGSLYEFHRNTATTANDFFNNRAGRFTANDTEVKLGQKKAGDLKLPRPKLLRNVFGGSVGGPIMKDRAFFFYNYEGRRDASEQSVVRDVPLPSLGRGEIRFTNTSGGVTTLTAADLNRLFPVGVNPAALAALADAARKYPANDFTRGDSRPDLLLNTAGFRFNASTPLRWNTHTLRLDQNLTKDGKQQLFFRGTYQQDVIGGPPQFPDTPRPQFWNHPWGIVAGHTWTVSNRTVNRFNYGFTREAFTNQGDSAENSTSFRFVFSPRRYVRTLSRTTPVHNFTDDLSQIRGTHTLQFGTNIRLISNNRTNFANSYDDAITNPSYYESSGSVLSDPITGIRGSVTPIQNAVAAVLGRFSQYTASFNFDKSGNVLPAGTGVTRDFATQEYDWYVQDIWKFRQNLTLTLGLRYSLSRPVYETNGLEVKPTLSLSEFFERRKAGAAAGKPYNELLTFDLAGPANNRPGYYNWDKNNFQPRIAVAWSPDAKSGFWHKLLGGSNTSVFRGGFAITNDHFGERLAVRFDQLNAVGFSSSFTIGPGTYNASTKPAPAFAGFGQDVRSLPRIVTPTKLTFPGAVPADESDRIEVSLDDKLVTPTSYSWNVSYGRKLRGGFVVDASYIGRLGRNLLITRDVAHLNNLVDPKSGVDWYTAARMLDDLRVANTPITSVQPIPYFENLFPGIAGTFNINGTNVALTATQAAYRRVARVFVNADPNQPRIGGRNSLDWTTMQEVLLDDNWIGGRNAFIHPQYGALSVFSTLGTSDYHGATLSIRQRFKEQVSFDFNYTWSKSMDDASGLQTSTFYGTAFILQPLDLHANRSVSDFDVRHIINFNSLWELPLGRGKAFFNHLPGAANALLGGWQLTTIFRWNSGLPTAGATPFDAAQWATNFNSQSYGVRIKPIKSSPNKATVNLFSDPVAAYQSYRNARAGEVGDRNSLRLPGYVALDAGLGKTFTMPWSENHKLQFRWETFNVTNTQRLGTLLGGRQGSGLSIDPNLTQPASTFGVFTGIQGTPRVMQFGLRYEF